MRSCGGAIQPSRRNAPCPRRGWFSECVLILANGSSCLVAYPTTMIVPSRQHRSRHTSNAATGHRTVASVGSSAATLSQRICSQEMLVRFSDQVRVDMGSKADGIAFAYRTRNFYKSHLATKANGLKKCKGSVETAPPDPEELHLISTRATELIQQAAR